MHGSKSTWRSSTSPPGSSCRPVSSVSAEEYLDARRRRFHYVRTMDELLGEDGLLLTPTLASDGGLADGRSSPDSDVHGLPPEVYSTALQNVTGHPALTLPFGMLPTGLPFGLQVTGAHYDDYLLARHRRPRAKTRTRGRATAPGYDRSRASSSRAATSTDWKPQPPDIAPDDRRQLVGELGGILDRFDLTSPRIDRYCKGKASVEDSCKTHREHDHVFKVPDEPRRLTTWREICDDV